MEESKPMLKTTQIDPNLIKKVDDDDQEMFDQETYQPAFGSLLLLSTKSRISYAVSGSSCFTTKQTMLHCSAVKMIFSYLKGTINLTHRPKKK